MTCPFIEDDYACCSHHLNMRRLDEAFAHCQNRYALCPVYSQLVRASAMQTTDNARPQLQTA